MSNFDLANLALQATCPNNELLYDDKGMPSVMVKIPKMTYAQLGLGTSTTVHPAFIVNGVEKDAIWISKYQNVVVDGRAYSLPARDPKTVINFDAAVSACSAKGNGWHLMTKAEWGLLALWCKVNGTMPYGNNNYGKDSRETTYKAIPTYYDAGKIGRVATGTGPLSWSHDRTPSGIWDVNGNVWEWNGGIRLVAGEVQIIANNNAADKSISQGASSSAWKAINAATGALITPDGSGTTAGSVKLDYISSKFTYSTSITDKKDEGRGCAFENVTCDATIGDAAKLLLQSLGMLKYDTVAGAYDSDYFWMNNGATERSLFSGGYWSYGANAGVFYSNGNSARSYAYGHVGFRSAFCDLSSD